MAQKSSLITSLALRRTLLAVGLAFGGVPALSQVVDIAWDASGQFAAKEAVAARKFVEVCGKLKKGQTVDWQFSSERPLDFNIHYHEGEKVAYPEKRETTSKSGGALLVAVAQDYCWMWTNRGMADASLTLRLNLR